MNRVFLTSLALGAALFMVAAHADDYVLTLKDHQFAPKELTIPAGQKVKIIINT